MEKKEIRKQIREKRQEHDEVESVLNSLQKMDQEMFYTSVTIITTADTKKELESNTLSLINAASRFGIVLETLISTPGGYYFGNDNN